MSLAEDPILGVSYIDPEYFLQNARIFGCERAVEGLNAPEALPLLASASRRIDAELGRNFLPDEIQENHAFDSATRRCEVNCPPLLSLVSFKIRNSAGLVTSYAVTPVSDDGENNIIFGSIFYNRQLNYLELASSAIQSSEAAAVGIAETQVEIVYTSYADVPKEVAAATAYLAAHLLNEAKANNTIAPGIASLKADDVEVKRLAQSGSSFSSRLDESLPAIVKSLLSPFTRVVLA